MALEKTERKIEERLANLDYLEQQQKSPSPLRRRVFEPFQMDWLDFGTMVAGVLFIIFSIFAVISPPLLPALFFGIALLITTAIRQWYYQVAVLAFTIAYWVLTFVFGVFIDALDISLFIFGINTISLGIFVAGSIAVMAAGIVGFTQGVYRTHRFAGLALFILTVVLGLFDYYFAVYVYLLPVADALIVVFVNMGVYLIALTVTYIIFYYVAKFYNFTKNQFNDVINPQAQGV